LDDSCNDKDEKISEEENKGDQYDQFEANVNKSGHELGEGNDCVAEKCGVDDCEEELEENQKPHSTSTINFNLEGNDVKVSIRDFGLYLKFNKECSHKQYKGGTENTYISAQLFSAPAAGQKTGRYEKKMIEREQLSILSSIRNEIQQNWDNTYINGKYNP
jgi:hypothetical protein